MANWRDCIENRSTLLPLLVSCEFVIDFFNVIFFIHSSLRTSETNYLTEAFSFYSAIRARGYYSKASKEERAELMVKKLRYYARFIVVCLLLKKMKLVRDLVRVC